MKTNNQSRNNFNADDAPNVQASIKQFLKLDK